MPLSLFLHTPKTHLTDNIAQPGAYKHTFGGTIEQFDLQLVGTESQLHLIYRIDLSDPEIPIQIPNIRFLPLLYNYGGDLECSYLVETDSRIKILNPTSPVDAPGFDVPDSYPVTATTFTKHKYDPTNADDVMQLKGVFGWDELSESEKKRALQLAKKLSSLTEDDGVDESWSYEDVINCMFEPPFSQGDPLECCQNPECKSSKVNSDKSHWMVTLAIQDNPVREELIWPDQCVQTIWMMCPECNSITSLNRL